MSDEQFDSNAALDRLRFGITQPNLSTDVDCVRIMGLPKSMGPATDLIVFVGCIEGALPRNYEEQAAGEQRSLREERRRLFSVAMAGKKKPPMLSRTTRLPRNLAYRIGIPSSPGSGTVGSTIAARFVWELGPVQPKPIGGTILSSGAASRPMTDHPRLIEVAFPLKQASLDSVHEKNVRHGHISTLHIWPARRPLAACRAALIATAKLPDPGTPEKRKELLEKIGGKVVTEVQKKKVGGKTVETIKVRTEGGVLRRGNENGPDMDWFREEIKKAYFGRAPRVLDPFAGGGAIPLEAMRLGCEVTAIDINPVAWFLLKCTLEYPQKLAGQVRPLPKFAVESSEFMEGFLTGVGAS